MFIKFLLTFTTCSVIGERGGIRRHRLKNKKSPMPLIQSLTYD